MDEFIKRKEYMNAQKEAHRMVMEEDWTKSLRKIMKMLYEHEAEQRMVEIVLQHWDDLFDTTNVILKAIRDFIVDKNILCYIIKQLDFLEDLPYLLERAFEHKKNNNYDIFARNIISLFTDEKCVGSDKLLTNTMNVNDLENLIDKAKQYQEDNKVDCGDIIIFLKYYIGGMKYAEKPKWVSLKEGENLSLLKTVSPGLAYEERKSASEKYLNKAKDLFVSIKDGNVAGEAVSVDMQKSLESFLSVMTDTDGNANRVFGPSNPFKEYNCVSNISDGPCRMLECSCRNSNEEDDTDKEDWFKGRCDNCMLQIRDRSHCVRIPMEEGGWDGCYCSFECMLEHMPFRNHEINLKLEAMRYVFVMDGIMDRAVL